MSVSFSYLRSAAGVSFDTKRLVEGRTLPLSEEANSAASSSIQLSFGARVSRSTLSHCGELVPGLLGCLSLHCRLCGLLPFRPRLARGCHRSLRLPGSPASLAGRELRSLFLGLPFLRLSGILPRVAGCLHLLSRFEVALRTSRADYVVACSSSNTYSAGITTATLWMGRVVILGEDRFPSGFPGLVYCTLTVRTHPSSPGQASTICPSL